MNENNQNLPPTESPAKNGTPFVPSRQLNKIVEAIYLDKRIKELVSKMHPPDLQDDLLSHCVLEIYRVAEKYPGKIEGLAERNEMFAWFSQVIKLQMTGSHSTFFRKYRRPFENIETLDYERPESPTYDFIVDSPADKRKGAEISIEIDELCPIDAEIAQRLIDNRKRERDARNALKKAFKGYIESVVVKWVQLSLI